MMPTSLTTVSPCPLSEALRGAFEDTTILGYTWLAFTRAPESKTFKNVVLEHCHRFT